MPVHVPATGSPRPAGRRTPLQILYSGRVQPARGGPCVRRGPIPKIAADAGEPRWGNFSDASVRHPELHPSAGRVLGDPPPAARDPVPGVRGGISSRRTGSRGGGSGTSAKSQRAINTSRGRPRRASPASANASTTAISPSKFGGGSGGARPAAGIRPHVAVPTGTPRTVSATRRNNSSNRNTRRALSYETLPDPPQQTHGPAAGSVAAPRHSKHSTNRTSRGAALQSPSSLTGSAP